MNEIKWAALAAAGLLVAAPESQATVTATATLSNFQFQLFDLDPGDGIAPSVSFDSGTLVSASARDTATTFTTSTSNSLFGAIGLPLSISASQGLQSFASAQTTAGSPIGALSGTSATASATTMGTDNSASAIAYTLTSGFTLSPRTLLVFSARPLDLAVVGSVLGESGSAVVSVGMNSNGPNPQQSNGQAVFSLGSNGQTSSPPPTGLVTASFSNLAADPLRGSAFAFAQVNVRSAPVPEPGSYALMLAGLMTVGALARMRRSR